MLVSVLCSCELHFSRLTQPCLYSLGDEVARMATSPSLTFSPTTFLAIWGAILSTIGLAWNFYRDVHDRAKVKVSASLKKFMTGADGRAFAVQHNLPVQGPASDVVLLFSFTNIGRRPVMLTTLGGKWHKSRNGKKGFVVITRDLPKMLAEGHYHLEYTNDMDAVGQNVKRLSVWDSTGKEWKLPSGELRKLKRETQDLQADC